MEVEGDFCGVAGCAVSEWEGVCWRGDVGFGQSFMGRCPCFLLRGSYAVLSVVFLNSISCINPHDAELFFWLVLKPVNKSQRTNFSCFLKFADPMQSVYRHSWSKPVLHLLTGSAQLPNAG